MRYLKHIKDTIGQNYIGLEFDPKEIQPYLDKLKEEIGDENFDIAFENKTKRDKGNYHLTLINVPEYNKLSKEMGITNFVNSLENIWKYEVDDLEFKGIGEATDSKRGNKSYFIVCNSDKLDAVRTRYGLSKKDLHITLAFNKKDVFKDRKDTVKWVI